jgi:hypothetical protein
MNEAAKLVTDSALGIDFKTIFLNNKAYTVYPETIKILCRAIHYWSQMDFNADNQTNLTVVFQIPENAPCMLRGLSVLVVGDVKHWKLKSRRLYKSWMKGSIRPKEFLTAVKEALETQDGQSFFTLSTLLLREVNRAASPK